MNYQVGDYVTTQFNKGYFRVEKVTVFKDVNPQTNKVEDRIWLLLKKALNDKFECKNLISEVIHVHWCKVVDEATRERIEIFFAENPKEKRKFDAFSVSTKGILHSAVACDEQEEVELHKAMQEIKNLGLTEQEINNLSVMKKYGYNGIPGSEVKDKKIFPICFININIETNEDGWRIFRLDTYGAG